MKVLILILVCFIHVHGESLQDINVRSQVKKQSTSISTSRSYYDNDYQGGYNTEVHILGSERKFNRVRFTDKMLSTWVLLHNNAQTYDLISQLKENGYVNSDGTLNNGVTQLNVPLTPGKIINKSKILNYYNRKYTTDWIFNELKNVNVLDSAGFLTNTDSFSDKFNNNDFDQYLNLIRNIKFNFSSPVIAEELSRDLVQFFRESSLTIIVTQEETTRYQSTKKGFWENFKDQMAGSFLGSIFYQDQIKTVKRQMKYTPNYDVITLFSNIYVGFGQSTYADGAQGDIRFFGLPEQQNVNFQYAKNNRNIEHIGGSISFLKNMDANQYWRESLSSTGYGFYFNELRDPSGSNGWMSARVVAGGFSQKGNSLVSFGLANYNSSFIGGSKLGVTVAWDGAYHIIQYLGLYAGLETNFGFNLFANEDNFINWQVSRYALGLQTGVSRLKLRLGYEWVYLDSTKAFENFTTSVGIYF